jgi:curved DNA-binding protein CbpA
MKKHLFLTAFLLIQTCIPMGDVSEAIPQLQKPRRRRGAPHRRPARPIHHVPAPGGGGHVPAPGGGGHVPASGGGVPASGGGGHVPGSGGGAPAPGGGGGGQPGGGGGGSASLAAPSKLPLTPLFGQTQAYKTALANARTLTTTMLRPDQIPYAQQLALNTNLLEATSVQQTLNNIRVRKILDGMSDNITKLQESLGANPPPVLNAAVQGMQNNVVSYQAASQMLVPADQTDKIDVVDAMFVMGYVPANVAAGSDIPLPSLAELTKNYHKLALRFHPDKGGSTDLFQQLDIAHKVIQDNITGASKPKVTALSQLQIEEAKVASSPALTSDALKQRILKLESGIPALGKKKKKAALPFLQAVKDQAAKFAAASQAVEASQQEVDALKAETKDALKAFPAPSANQQQLIAPMLQVVEVSNGNYSGIPMEPAKITPPTGHVSPGASAGLMLSQDKLKEMQANLFKLSKTDNITGKQNVTLKAIERSVKSIEEEEAKEKAALTESGDLLDKADEYIKQLAKLAQKQQEPKEPLDVIALMQQARKDYLKALPQDMPHSQLGKQTSKALGSGLKQLVNSFKSIHPHQPPQPQIDSSLEEMRKLIEDFEASQTKIKASETRQNTLEKRAEDHAKKLMPSMAAPNQHKLLEAVTKGLRWGLRKMPK